MNYATMTWFDVVLGAIVAVLLLALLTMATRHLVVWTPPIALERLSDEDANAYYDGRKLINDNQRNYIDIQAGRPVRSEGWSE